MGKIISKIVGAKKAPAMSPQPAKDIEEEKKKAKTARSAIYATEGGAAGQEIMSVSRRDTMMGN